MQGQTANRKSPHRGFAARGLVFLAAIASLALLPGSVGGGEEAKASLSVRAAGPYQLPAFHGTGSVTLTGYWQGTAKWDYSSGSYCIYIQHKHVARLGLDGSWNRLTSDSCSTTKTANWSRPTDRPFNLQKFRLCQNKPNALDPCGESITTGKAP